MPRQHSIKCRRPYWVEPRPTPWRYTGCLSRKVDSSDEIAANECIPDKEGIERGEVRIAIESPEGWAFWVRWEKEG